MEFTQYTIIDVLYRGLTTAKCIMLLTDPKRLKGIRFVNCHNNNMRNSLHALS